MSITKKTFGKLSDGRETSIFTLTNQKGMVVEISDFGGIVLSIIVPDKKGNFYPIYHLLEIIIKNIHINQ